MAAGASRYAVVGGPRESAQKEPLYRKIDAWLGYPWVGVLLIVAAIVLPLFRQQGTPSWQTVWAEDSTIYTHQAVFYGSFHSLFRGYNGYLQLPSRLLAIPTPYFSLRYLAVYLALVSTGVGAFLAWSLYSLTARWLGSRLLRVTLASFVVLMPVLGPESTATITNTTWMFLAVLPWALVSLEERRRDAVLRSVLVFLGATSSALSVIFLPLVVGWLVYRRTRTAFVVGASFLIGLVIQACVTLTSPPPTNASIDLPVLAKAVSVRIFGAFLLGTRGEAAWWSANWASLVVLGPLIVVAILVALGIGASRRAQVMAGTFALFSIIWFLIPAWGRNSVYLGIGPNSIVQGYRDLWGESRFSVVPVMLLASAIAILIAPTGSPSVERRSFMRRICIPTFAAWTLIVVAVSFPQTTHRGLDVAWTGRVNHVLASECSGRPGSTLATVPNLVNIGPPFPITRNGYYSLVVRCSNLE